MKIVVYFNSLQPAGGIERVISSHIQFLSEESHQLILITKDDGESFFRLPNSVTKYSLDIDIKLNMNNRIKRLFKIFTTLFITIFRLNKILNKIKPDIVYTAHPLCLLEVKLSNFNLKKIYVTEHASVNAYNRIYRIILNILYPKVGLLSVPTTTDSKLYSSLGIKNVYIPNPLPFYPTDVSSLQNKIVLNVGRLTNDKRHDLLINLWSKSNGKSNGWKLKIIGTGENYIRLQKLIKELSLETSVFIELPTKNIENEYLSSSIFVLSSIAEGFGMVLAEAMSCGVPCISFDCPSGPKDIIRDGYNGYLIDEGNELMYINRLNELMKDYSIRYSLGNQARKDIRKFDSNHISKKINQLVKEMF